MSNARPARRSTLGVGRSAVDVRSQGGYGVIGYLVIGAVVLTILAGAVLLVVMIMNSMTSQESSSEPTPSSIGQCASGTWFDSATATCVPRTVCKEGENYQESTNTCTVPPPKALAVAPATGLAGGGTKITITGTGFAPGASVEIDGVPATAVTVESDTEITATTPGSANLYPVDILVQNPDGPPALLDNAFTYVPKPIDLATAVNPPRGSKDGGEAVIIRGTGFVDGVVVAFGGRAATNVIVLDANTLRVTTPTGRLGPTTVNIRLPGQDAFVLEDAFAYANQPPRVVRAVRPLKGPQAGGTRITIAGTGFAKGATVTVGKRRATKVKVVSTTRITAVTPVGPLGKVTVGVRNPTMPAAFLARAFTYVEAPTITGVKPIKGPKSGGTKLTVTGTGFLPGAVVSFGGTPAKKIKVVNPTTITLVTPKGKVGPVAVTVENKGQPIATLKKGFTYGAGPKPTPEPTTPPSTSPGGSTPGGSPPSLPQCKALRPPSVSTAVGSDLVLTDVDLFPSSVTGATLTSVTFAGTSGGDAGSVSWRGKPPRIVWNAPSGRAVTGVITFDYTATSCQGSGSGSRITVFSE